MKQYSEDELRKAVATAEERMLKMFGGLIAVFAIANLALYPDAHPLINVIPFIFGLTFLAMGVVWKKRR